MGIAYGLLASFCTALGFVLLKKSYKSFPPSVAFSLDVVFGLLIWVPFSLVVGIRVESLSTVLIFALISAILSEAFIFYILSKGELSITGTIFASYPIYTILFSLFINGDRPNPTSWLFILLTILGTIIVSLPKKVESGELKKRGFILWALAGALAVGLSDSLSKNIIDKSSAETFLFALAFAQIPVGLIYLRLEKQKLSQFMNIFKKFTDYKFAIFGSLFNIGAVLFLWLAFQETFASIASPLTATYPGVVIILAIIFLKEKISIKDLAGLAIIITGIIGISYYY